MKPRKIVDWTSRTINRFVPKMKTIDIFFKLVDKFCKSLKIVNNHEGLVRLPVVSFRLLPECNKVVLEGNKKGF